MEVQIFLAPNPSRIPSTKVPLQKETGSQETPRERSKYLIKKYQSRVPRLPHVHIHESRRQIKIQLRGEKRCSSGTTLVGVPPGIHHNIAEKSLISNLPERNGLNRGYRRPESAPAENPVRGRKNIAQRRFLRSSTKGSPANDPPGPLSAYRST